MKVVVLDPHDTCEMPFHPELRPLENVSNTDPEVRYVCVRSREVVGSLAVWRSGTAAYRGKPTRYFGHISAIDREVLASLLVETARSEASYDRTLIGPIDGSTWSRYRVVTESDDSAPFPLEPANPRWWADAFEDAGFPQVERYWSAVRDVASSPCSEPSQPPAGVAIRSLSTKKMGDDLGGIYALAVHAFEANPLYTPITDEQFRAMYLPIAERIDPRLCMIAEREYPVGVMLAIPGDAERLVLKTIAVADSERGKGLGSYLLEEMARRGMLLGYKQIVYALMHERNRSSDMVAKVAIPMRRYALYACGGR